MAVKRGKEAYLHTEQELRLRGKWLAIIKEIFGELNIDWFLIQGALLGVYRDGGLIPYDHDIDIALRAEETEPRVGEIIEAFKERGFSKAEIVYGFYEREKITRFSVAVRDPECSAKFNDHFKSGIGYSIEFWRRCQGFRTLIPNKDNGRPKGWHVPARFFEKKDKVKLYGISYPSPCPIEEYLEWQYGDWKTPKNTRLKEFTEARVYDETAAQQAIKEKRWQ